MTPATLSSLMLTRGGSIDPRAFPEEEFDLYSIPAYDARMPERVLGADIGSTKQVVEPGDVLVSKIVPHIRRAWTVAPSAGRRLIASGEWIVFRGSVFEPAYLRHFLLSDFFHDQFMQTVAGVGGSLMRARPAFVGLIGVPLPPLDEQRRIAAILDQADALRAKRRETIAHLDEVLWATADQQIHGRGARCVPLGSIARFVRGVTFKPTDVLDAEQPAAVACMRTSNVQETLKLNDVWRIHQRFVRRPEQWLSAGDTLVSSANSWSSVGRCCLVPELEGPATFGGFVSVLRSNSELLDPIFLYLWFSSRRVQETVRSFGRQTTNISNLDLHRTLELSMPLPAVEEQRVLRGAFEGIHEHRAQLDRHLAALDSLFVSLQDRAFKGEL